MNGKVYLIGAGPGDPELMTLKAARALSAADVILIDDLVSRGCLAHARSDTRVVEVGKRGGCTSTPQEFIDRLMILHARQGKVVARLKGGDPFVFGRGGEEMQALVAAGIEVDVIPGITAGIGVPATLVIYMGIACLEHIVRQLCEAGMSPAMPACVIENGTLGNQRQAVGTLASLAATAKGMGSPAIIVIGEVVRYARVKSGSVPERRVA